MYRLPTLFLAATLTLVGTALAQSPSPTPLQVEAGKSVELLQLTFNDEKNAFVDPATLEPFTGRIIVTYPTGQPETIGQLEDGLESGYWTEYYETGTKSAEGRYDAGNETGLWYFYWENGKIESTGEFDAGSMTGVWTDYFESGKIATQGSYTDSQAEGSWKIADEATGDLVTVEFENGKEVTSDEEAATSDATPTPTP